jgi:hypothetical protein
MDDSMRSCYTRVNAVHEVVYTKMITKFRKNTEGNKQICLNVTSTVVNFGMAISK